MPDIIEGQLVFSFPVSFDVLKYDDCHHYRDVWSNPVQPQKGVDITAVDDANPTARWLIEAKDFRVISNPPNPSNLGTLAQTVNQKIRDSISGLADAATNATYPNEKQHAVKMVNASRSRIVLHLEPYAGTTHTALFPVNFSVNVFQQLRILVRDLDTNASVLNIASTPNARVPWTVS